MSRAPFIGPAEIVLASDSDVAETTGAKPPVPDVITVGRRAQWLLPR